MTNIYDQIVHRPSMPRPSLPPDMIFASRFRRLYPDSAIHVEAERLEAAQASLFGVFAAQSLLLAFSLKLKMSAAMQQPDKTVRQGECDHLQASEYQLKSDVDCEPLPCQCACGWLLSLDMGWKQLFSLQTLWLATGCAGESF